MSYLPRFVTVTPKFSQIGSAMSSVRQLAEHRLSRRAIYVLMTMRTPTVHLLSVDSNSGLNRTFA